MPYHVEHAVRIPATAPVLFEYLDDPARLGAHMGKSSWMMAGARMTYAFDAAKGRSAGGRIRLSGRMLGLTLSVDEVVTRHEPPFRKAWKTVGTPRLLIMGNYEMGFEVEPDASASRLRVHISYELPHGAWWLAGWLLGGLYAHWCVRSMANDAARHFSAAAS
jgi:hypothetical protein